MRRTLFRHLALKWTTRVTATLALVFLVAAVPSGGHATTAETAEQLRALISDRLSLMPEVAKFKWNRGLPVEDLPREKIILDTVVQKARAAGIPERFATDFFQSQMNAAKIVQSDLVNMWRQTERAPFKTVENLRTDIRPKLDQMTAALLIILKDLSKTSNAEAVAPVLTPVPELWKDHPKAWQAAIQPFVKGPNTE